MSEEWLQEADFAIPLAEGYREMVGWQTEDYFFVFWQNQFCEFPERGVSVWDKNSDRYPFFGDQPTHTYSINWTESNCKRIAKVLAAFLNDTANFERRTNESE